MINNVLIVGCCSPTIANSWSLLMPDRVLETFSSQSCRWCRGVAAAQPQCNISKEQRQVSQLKGCGGKEGQPLLRPLGKDLGRAFPRASSTVTSADPEPRKPNRRRTGVGPRPWHMVLSSLKCSSYSPVICLLLSQSRLVREGGSAVPSKMDHLCTVLLPAFFLMCVSQPHKGLQPYQLLLFT